MTYEYICDACGHEWEAEQPISAAALRDCPKCEQAKARRQVSGGTGFLLKGGGWYADGYGSKRSAGSADSPSSSSTTSSPSASTSAASSSGPASKATATSTGAPKSEGAA